MDQMWGGRTTCLAPSRGLCEAPCFSLLAQENILLRHPAGIKEAARGAASAAAVFPLDVIFPDYLPTLIEVHQGRNRVPDHARKADAHERSGGHTYLAPPRSQTDALRTIPRPLRLDLHGVWEKGIRVSATPAGVLVA